MSSRAVSIVLASLLNLGIIYALVSGLASSAVKLAIQNIKVAVIPPPPDESKPPPPPPPQMKEPPPFVPPPDINIDITEAAPATTAITNVQTQAPTAPAPAPSTPPKALNSHAVTDRDYPPISIRLNEEGKSHGQVSGRCRRQRHRSAGDGEQREVAPRCRRGSDREALAVQACDAKRQARADVAGSRGGIPIALIWLVQ